VTYRRGMPFTDAAIAVDVSAEATTSTGGSEASLKKSPVENTSTPTQTGAISVKRRRTTKTKFLGQSLMLPKGAERRPVMAVSSVDGKRPARRQMATMLPTSTRRLPVLMVVSIRGSPPSGNFALR
jgi:hypothetical protein